MTFRLQVKATHGPQFDHVFSGDSLLIGRSGDADLIIPDPSLSRRHARLFLDGEQLMIEDLGSQNGTWVDGTRVRQTALVMPGALIKVSENEITVQCMDRELLQVAEVPEDPGSETLFFSAAKLLDAQEKERPDVAVSDIVPQRYVQRLKILNEVHKALSQSLSVEELLELILDRAFEYLKTDEGTIFLKGEGEELYAAASKTSSGKPRRFVYSRHLVHEVVEKGMAALVRDVSLDERFTDAMSIVGFGVRSFIAAPLLEASGAMGMIVLNSRGIMNRFSEGDLELLVSLASVATMRLRNLKLAEEAASRQRMEEELKLARRIQVALLPDRLPRLPGYEILARNVPSLGVSGDYYQVLERADGRECVLLIADVSGKGMSASLLTASLEALAAGPIEDGHPPDEICRKLSRMLFQRTPLERYATLFLSTLEPATGIFRFTNAGHNPALLLRASGETELLGANGLPIGILKTGSWSCDERVLEPGDLLVLYTDGITEAANAKREEFGTDRLKDICGQSRNLPLEDINQALQRELDQFVAGTPYGDDRTLVLLRRIDPDHAIEDGDVETAF